jgi:hypothetical protein
MSSQILTIFPTDTDRSSASIRDVSAGAFDTWCGELQELPGRGRGSAQGMVWVCPEPMRSNSAVYERAEL